MSLFGVDWESWDWNDTWHPGEAEEKKRTAEREANKVEPAPFEFSEFTYPEFNKEDIGFTTRKQSPLDFTGLMKQGRQRQAITGVPTSEAFYKGIAEPMLKTKAKENVALTELENQRRIDEEKQAFTEYAFNKSQASSMFQFNEGMKFDQYKFDISNDLAKKQLGAETASMQAQADAGDDISVICSELCRQGLLHRNVLKADGEYRRLYIDDETYYGYLSLAEPVVRLMQRSKIFTIIIKPIAVAFAYETASRVDENIKGSLFGKFILEAGKRVCKNYFRIRNRFINMRKREVV